MNGLESADIAKVVSASDDALTFAWLYRHVQEYATASHAKLPSSLERWSFWIGIVMALLGLLAASLSGWLPPKVAIRITTICLMAEVAGLGLFVVLMLRREAPQLIRARQLHATEMDVDFAKWQRLVVELRRFPKAQRQARLRFVSRLRQSMGDRMGLFFGGVQRLGIFPLLVALYLQFRNWKWGDWAGAFDVNIIAGLLIWTMMLMYAAGWLMVGLRSRLDSYVTLLEESLQD